VLVVDRGPATGDLQGFTTWAHTPLCVPKIRFDNIGDEDRQGQAVIWWHRRAQSTDGTRHPCPV